MDINKLAYDWIYELYTDMYKIQKLNESLVGWAKIVAENSELRLFNDQRKFVEYKIEKRVWYERYRKVFQLCWSIGGEVLDKFNRMFPDGENTVVRYTERGGLNE